MQWYHFDFLILCIGKYGGMPKIPSFPPNKGSEVFEGKVLHTMDYSALNEKEAYEIVKGKKNCDYWVSEISNRFCCRMC